MLIRLTDDLAIRPDDIAEVIWNPKGSGASCEPTISVVVASGDKWLLYHRSKRYYNKLIKRINDALRMPEDCQKRGKFAR